KFTIFNRDPNDNNSISHNSVKKIIEDQNGNLWVGTQNGLNRYDRKENRFYQDYHDPTNPNSISGNNVNSLFRDSMGKIWIGTASEENQSGRLNVYDEIDINFTTYSFPQYTDPSDKRKGAISAIYEDHRGKLSVGTENAGLLYFDRKTSQFTRMENFKNNNL